MIEHGLYLVGKKDMKEKLILMPKKHATFLVLSGYEVYDLYESLDMSPDLYEKETLIEI